MYSQVISTKFRCFSLRRNWWQTSAPNRSIWSAWRTFRSRPGLIHRNTDSRVYESPINKISTKNLTHHPCLLFRSFRCLYSLFGRGASSVPPIRMYYIMWMVFFNFYISHWEKYNTGVLYLPWGYDFSMWVRRWKRSFCRLPFLSLNDFVLIRRDPLCCIWPLGWERMKFGSVRCPSAFRQDSQWNSSCISVVSLVYRW